MRIKTLVICFAMMFGGITISQNSSAQSREPQNIYRVTVNSRYVIVNGERTKEFFAIGQMIYDSLGRLHTEIDFDWETHSSKNFRWHYFEGNIKYKTDFFQNDKLHRIEEYAHDTNGNLVDLTIFHVSESDTSLVSKVKYGYFPNGKIQTATGFDGKGKKGFKAKYKYDANGTEISRKISGKRVVPPDSILSLVRVPKYDSFNRIVEEMVTINMAGKGNLTRKKYYEFDDKGNLVKLLEQDANGSQISRIEYIYRPDNRIQQKKIYDSNNNLIDWLAWRYEIYKTRDRRQRILE